MHGHRRPGNRVGSSSHAAFEPTVGGTTSGAGNLISGNVEIGLTNAANFSVIQGNRIGTDATGVAPLGNGGIGVRISAFGATVGGTEAGAGNTIAFNGGAGVVDQLVEFISSERNAIRGNSIHSNGGLGIDLNGDGVTPNDPGDADSGPNGLQNFPVLSVALAGGSTGVSGLTARPIPPSASIYASARPTRLALRGHGIWAQPVHRRRRECQLPVSLAAATTAGRR